MDGRDASQRSEPWRQGKQPSKQEGEGDAVASSNRLRGPFRNSDSQNISYKLYMRLKRWLSW